ncbi:172c38b2-e7cc-4812-acfc-69185e554c38-CDS [Sclerotinia trifoliorum]|uniref:172c38b2-e7cc-4812-acfc-69185e554c38-CDS n=1 Tax=Sclerotinia trifoliorum TaxID=28548 RepID=A0A8H2W4S4_9HELO|nr:172c38b2-e7cc-4812-acfc-69185e554c38-CDS [Sclerotinia trifoliorum]
MTEARPPVPKFASFRSKTSSTAANLEQEDEQKLATRGKQHTQERDHPRHHHRHHRSRSREKHRSRSKENTNTRDSRHRSRSRERHRIREKENSERHGSHRRSRSRDDRRTSRRPVHEGKVQRDSKEEPTKCQPDVSESVVASDIYVVDRKGDVKNLVYGSNYRYSVPLFHRIGAGRILGAPRDTKIDREYSDDKGIVLTNLTEFRSNNREKYIFSKVERDRPRLLKMRPEALAGESFLHDKDYVPFQISRGKKRKRVDREPGSKSDSDHDDTHYRSIQGKAKISTQPQDDAFQYASDSDSSGSDAGRTMRLESSIKQKNMELSRRIEQAPGDVEAWLALIAHQDTLLKAEDGHRRITNAEIRSTADIKIHMYEKALENIQYLPARERLLLGLMAEGSKIWEIKVQAERWEQIAKDNIDSLVLWKRYLDFRESNFSTFRYEEVRGLFIDRIRSLKISISVASRWTSVGSLYEQLLYVVLRATLFIRESGFTELAVATWQAILEMNFQGPESIHAEYETSALAGNKILELFGEFWEAEVPRIGELGSLGWKSFAETGDDSTVPNAQTDEPEMSLNGQDLFKSWVMAESSRIKASRIPARTMDDTVEDDPFRVILFTDIENFLILLPKSAEYLRRTLLNAFLIFCHLPPMPFQNHESGVDWSHDFFLHNEMLDYDSEWIKGKYFKKPSEDSIEGEKTEMPSIFTAPTTNLAMAQESMFSKSWFSSFKPWREVYGNEDNGPIPCIWVRNTLKQLTQSYPTEDFAEYYLAFEWINEPSTIKKVAKSLIKQHSSSLKLYNAYAMIEWSKGNQEISNGIYMAALGMSKSMPSSPESNDNKDSIHLWKSLVWAHLSVGSKETALSHLLSIPHGIPNLTSLVEITPAALLKSQQHLSSNRDHFVTTRHPTYAALYTELLALLKYLTTTSPSAPQSPQQGNIASALEILTTFSDQLSSRIASNLPSSYTLALIHQSMARLLHHHAKSGPYRPQTLHSQLTASLRLFPSNTVFFSLLTSPAFGTTRLMSPVTLSNLFSELLDSSSTHNPLPLYLHIIHHHLQHVQSATPNLNKVNSTFVSALNLKCSKSSPTLNTELASSSSLWKLYLLFCDTYPQFLPLSASSSSSSSKALILQSSNGMQNNEAKAQKQKAKGTLELWKQAISRLPWLKSIYTFGFERICEIYCQDEYEYEYENEDGEKNVNRVKANGRGKKPKIDSEITAQLKNVWRVMGEKEIRVHVDLEGVWDAEEEEEGEG